MVLQSKCPTSFKIKSREIDKELTRSELIFKQKKTLKSAVISNLILKIQSSNLKSEIISSDGGIVSFFFNAVQNPGFVENESAHVMD